MTAIDAEARAAEHEHIWRDWSYAQPDSEDTLLALEICDGVIHDECDAIQYAQVPDDPFDYLRWIGRWRRDMQCISRHLARPSGTNNDFDEQEAEAVSDSYRP